MSELLIRRVVTADRGQTHTDPRTRREKHRRDAEKAAHEAVLTLGYGMHRAIEVAEVCNLRWRIVACALRRLSRAGLIEERVVNVPGKCRTLEQTRIYGRMQTPFPVRFARLVTFE